MPLKLVFSNIADSGSSSANDQNYLDIESNSTPQTVYSSNNVKLHHKRIMEPSELPRRINAFNAPYEQPLSSTSPRQNQLREYLLQQYNPTNEMLESKQMLFDKHMDRMGDDTALSQTKSRQRFNVAHDQSDDCISSTYPNSSRSTIRDLTCSSISSTMAQSTAFDSSANVWQDMNENDSTMNNPLNKPNTSRSNLRTANIHPTTITEHTFETIPRNAYHSYANTQRFAARSHIDRATRFQRGKSVESSEPTTTTTIRNGDIHSNSQIYGYTREHLLRAEKFGSVIKIIRKPGHHVGPTKNPDCECAHCRRWFDERRNLRERALSMDVISSIGLSAMCDTIDQRSKHRFNTNIV